jgi:calcineurin-like phosphoesterase family protein
MCQHHRTRLLKRLAVPPLLVVLVLGCCTESAAERVKIAVFGDSRENLDGAAEGIASILLNKITDWDFIIHTGDFTHAGKKKDWEQSLAVRGMDRLFVKGRLLLCTSNHDSNKKNWDKYTAGVLPTNSADGTTHFYACKLKNVHVLACDSYFTEPAVVQRWLDEYLKGVKPDEWLIAVWHCPSYGDITYKAGLKSSRAWLESLYRHGGDFVINGHAHVYLRTKPLRPDGTIDERRGIVHVINGVGGATWKDPQPYTSKTAYTPATKSFPAITFLTLQDGVATLQTIDARPGKNCAVVDQAKRSKNRPPEPGGDRVQGSGFRIRALLVSQCEPLNCSVCPWALFALKVGILGKRLIGSPEP